jgi:hypothetical protein
MTTPLRVADKIHTTLPMGFCKRKTCARYSVCYDERQQKLKNRGNDLDFIITIVYYVLYHYIFIEAASFILDFSI